MIGAKMKYVTFRGYGDDEQIIIFPKVIQHSYLAEQIAELSFGELHPISGGFVVDGECVGRSESLMMDSRGGVDTALIPKMLDLDCSSDAFEDLVGFPHKPTNELGSTARNNRAPLSKNQLKRQRKKAGGRYR